LINLPQIKDAKRSIPLASLALTALPSTVVLEEDPLGLKSTLRKRISSKCIRVQIIDVCCPLKEADLWFGK
jgi:hypothetical protein